MLNGAHGGFGRPEVVHRIGVKEEIGSGCIITSCRMAYSILGGGVRGHHLNDNFELADQMYHVGFVNLVMISRI